MDEHSRIFLLEEGWELTCTAPDECSHPHQLDTSARAWRPAKVPGTVAASVHTDIGEVGDYDAKDWWYRVKFAVASRKPSARYRLHFAGLATLAQVWLNGIEILFSRNMFRSYRIDVSEILATENELVVSFRSLGASINVKRSRPRWKTKLVDQQNLRWFRTTLLGRISSWTPAITPVGPWRPIRLECAQNIELVDIRVNARAESAEGFVEIDASILLRNGVNLTRARFRLGKRDDYELAIVGQGNLSIRGRLRIPGVPLWWPHTHGLPHLLSWSVDVEANGHWVELDHGSMGFKSITVDQSDAAVQFRVNDVPVFCRGACWTTIDFLSLAGETNALRRALEMARDAGVNMLRICGTMVYESTEFYCICDELGILVWQDFMFANMDYPVADTEFGREIEDEVRQQLSRLQRHVCISAYCGGSEIAQQAAMLGLPAEEWSNEFFLESLPRMCAELHAGIPYFPSTPWGGALPFHISAGVSHYYGVGAYRRPLVDARVAGIKFTTECLGFSNVPEPETIALLSGGAQIAPHHPKWKARVPRDSGSGWDFEDIRDFYLNALFGIDPIALRSQDVERYYAISCVVTGEIMQRCFSEWRRPLSGCGGALVWFYRDLWPGAGWGITDSAGRPKAAWWYLKRAWAPRAIRLTDEGLNGLDIHVINEVPETLHASVELDLMHAGRKIADTPPATVHLLARESKTIQVDALLGYFSDCTEAYRFGPAKFDVIAVRLRDSETKCLLSEDYYFPSGLGLPMQQDVLITSHAVWSEDGSVLVTLKSSHFLQAVCISSKGFSPDDNYFHLVPDLAKAIRFAPPDGGADKFKAQIGALNLATPHAIRATRECPAARNIKAL